MENREFGQSYLAIEEHVRRARAERAFYVAELIANGLAAVVRGIARLGALLAAARQARAPVTSPPPVR